MKDQQQTAAPERMAPGHVYNPALGSGIEWRPHGVLLWERGQITATGQHDSVNAWDFWYNLAFRESFPQVTHWWFGSAWTGRVWLWPEDGGADELTIGGWMQFVDQREPPLAWQITAGVPAQVAVPMPPLQVNPINLPLRVALAYQALGLFSGDVRAALPPDQLAALEAELIADGTPPNQVKLALEVASPALFVTSLVPRAGLATAFPTTMGAWRLEQVEAPLRQALCTLMGLRPPTISERWTVVEPEAIAAPRGAAIDAAQANVGSAPESGAA